MRLATLVLFLAVVAEVRAAAAADQSGPTPPRLSFVDGEVSFWRPGAEDWTPAQANIPLAAGDSLYAGDNGNLEVEVHPGVFVRAGAGSELGLETLDDDLRQFKLTSGHAAVDVTRLPKGKAIEIDTPSAAFTIDGPGYFRVDVDDDKTTFTTRRGGRATMVPADGDATDVDPDAQVVLDGTESPKITKGGAPEPDEWDRWNLDRTQPKNAPARSDAYVSPDVAGRRDLDRYGEWRDTPSYGHVWVPHDVPSGWAPYSTGRWIYDPYYGWTWIDDAPWGWAPYHYGRWVYYGGYWGWAPGPVVVAPVYAPALVAFFGPVTVSVGPPFVSWVALGFGEPLIPWWGPVGFHGHCWWGGWGGPRYVNNVVINRNTYINVRNVTVYRNQRVRNAVVAVDREHFGRGRAEHVRVGTNEAGRLRPVRGQLGVRPTPASLAPREGHGPRPAERVHDRPVVATRAPQDVSRRLRAAGLDDRGANAVKPPRVRPVNEQRGAAHQPASPAERRTPPPAPGAERRQHGQPGENRGGAPSREARPVAPGARPTNEPGTRANRNEPGAHGTANEPGSHGSRNQPGDVRRAPQPAPARETPPPPRVERQAPSAAPAPPRHGPQMPTAPAAPHDRSVRPAPPASGGMERGGSMRPSPPVGGGMPAERGPEGAPHNHGGNGGAAPHGNPHPMAPGGGQPGARWESPQPRVQAGRVERFPTGGARERPQHRGGHRAA